jgi:glutamate---cysteine ligase / carboxylate-amine ligase
MTMTAERVDWAAWTPSSSYSLGVEEEVMLLRPPGLGFAQEADAIHAALPAALASHVSTETHNGALELSTGAHASAAAAAAELRFLRGQLQEVLRADGLAVAVSGTHPWATWQDVEISSGPRYAEVYRTMRDLARREPTFAQHVHVGVSDPEQAVALLRALRGHLPLLLAVSANSPFWRGHDSGLASARSSIFRMFPRVGIPRRFGSYPEYVEAVDVMIRCGAIPEPTFLWWDVRLQPRLGTVEVRIMDAQSSLWQTAALAAFVQSIAHLELEGGSPAALEPPPEILDENVFVAARDGLAARLLDPVTERQVPIASLLEALLGRLYDHAEELGCTAELDGVRELARRGGGAGIQRAVVAERGAEALLPALAAAFTFG